MQSSPVRLVLEKEGFEGSLSLPGIDVVSTDLKSLSSDVLAGAKVRSDDFWRCMVLLW